MIKVLSIVSYPFLPARTGGQISIAQTYRHLSGIVNLTCVTTRNNDPRSAPGYEVLNILSDSPLRYINIFYFFRLRNLIRERKITHLLLDHPYFGWLGAWLKWSTGVKLVVRSHNIEGLRWKSLNKWWWKILWRYERWTHRRADYNFFIQARDLAYAVEYFGLQPEKCLVFTYGINQKYVPGAEEKRTAREQLLRLHSIAANHTIILFNGAFNYRPNLQALKKLLYEINPLLTRVPDFSYSILICGKDIPADISSQSFDNVVFAGFVDDIKLYFTGADIFVNPVTEGGGIQTKLVEALGFNLNVVSMENGAIGIDPSFCNGKISVVKNDDYNAFVKAVVSQSKMKIDISREFYDHFNYDNIVARAVNFISKEKPR